MISSIVVVFWGLTLLNLRGLHISARANNVFVLLGTLLPMAFLIALGFFWFSGEEPIYVSFVPSEVIPALFQLDTWVALVAVIGSFLGMELSTVHLAAVDRPQRTFPIAFFFATLVVLFTMLFGALTIAAVLPQAEINLAGGIMQVFDAFFHEFHLQALIPAATCFIILGSIGGLINWMISPSKGLHFAAKHGFLPTYFTRENSRGVASRVLITQAIIVTFLCGLLFYLPTVNGFYWFLSALSTALYMLMYLMIFLAALRLRKHVAPATEVKRFIIPGGKPVLWAICLSGMVGTSLTFCLGFVPPSNVDIGSPVRYTVMIGIGMALFIAPLFLIFRYKKRKNHAHSGQ
jgi:amino acid transporter